jgi:DNA invertase Pin-like site-specific DNA recombinase
MKIGYARTSTTEQVYSLEAQIEQLQKEGCDPIFSEQESATDLEARTEWDKAVKLAKANSGSIIYVTKCDRVARSMIDLCKIQEELNKSGTGLNILDMKIDTATASGALMLNIMGSFAEFERSIMKERQAIGIARAKAADALLPKHHPEKKYQGNPKTTITTEQRDMVVELAKTQTKEAIARSLGIGVASVYRILKASS